MLDRRTLISAAAAAAATRAGAQTPAGLSFGPAEPFDFEGLSTLAKTLAAKPYEAAPRVAPDILQKIDYETHGKIRYRPDKALFADGPGQYPATFFHLGQYFQKPVRMHVVANGSARELLYSPDLFDMPADSIARKLPPNAGFAGFRFQESRDGHIGREGKPLDWRRNDWVAFLGAS